MHVSPTPKNNPLWHYCALSGILLLSIFLNFYNLESEGYANFYYAAAVKSMLSSWRNFFFVSFDPAGFVSVDKPPLGLWLQAASAYLLGFNGWNLILPQALAGVLSVLLLFHLVKRIFGATAGVIAALVLAITPISVAANRNNTMDSTLVLVLLLAAWAASLAAEKGKLCWLLLSMCLVGIGFNIKMLQAYLVLPAFLLVYLFTAHTTWWKRIIHIGLGSLVLLIISLCWAITVDLVPPEQRPYVGSSQNNTVLELVIGHNGMSRLFPGGLRRFLHPNDIPRPRPPIYPPAFPKNVPGNQPPSPEPIQPDFQNIDPQDLTLPSPQYSQPPIPYRSPVVNNPGPLKDETGKASLFRLFNQQLFGQTSWLFPIVLLGMIAATWQSHWRYPLIAEHQSLLLWGLWLLPQLTFFSYANLFHRYYLEMLSPALAALIGAGIYALWKDYQGNTWKAWLLPISILICALYQSTFLFLHFPYWGKWLAPFILVVGLPCVFCLMTLRLLRNQSKGLKAIVLSLGLASLLLAPLAWSLTPIIYGGHSGLPYAGPELHNEREQPMMNDEFLGQASLLEYLQSHRSGERFLLGTLRATDAAPYIISTGEPVMALGGFTGSDPILNEQSLSEKVEQGEIRFFLLPQKPEPQNLNMNWIRQHCAVVPTRVWSGKPTQAPGQPPVNRGMLLFDCYQLPTNTPMQPIIPTNPEGRQPPIYSLKPPDDLMDEHTVLNPTSGATLKVTVVHPLNWNGKPLPTLVLVPGGIGTFDPQKAIRLAQAGFTVIFFDPDGRGRSGGDEDYGGFIHQDGLAAVIQSAINFAGVDVRNIGLVSYSYGITMASGVLARYPILPVRFLIDWEGPADRYDTTVGCKPNPRVNWADCSDHTFWSQREAIHFIEKIKVPYQRIQSEKDHVQPDLTHAIEMVNNAIKGNVPWVRLNDLLSNQTYDPASPPAMLPEADETVPERLIARYARELFKISRQFGF